MIAIWGANGFIGRHLVARLARTRKQIALFSRDYKGFPFPLPPSAQANSCDFFHPEIYQDKLRDCHTLILLVSASAARTFSESPEQEILLNVQPYRNFFDQLGSQNTLPQHIIYISSGGAIYGVTTPISIVENAPLNPVSTYGQGKHEIEGIVAKMAPSYTILRPANPIGIWNKRKFLIDYAFEAIKTGVPLKVFGDGEAVRDYFDVGELAEAIRLSIDNPAARNEIFNVGSGKGMTVNKIISLIEEATGKEVPRQNIQAHGHDVPHNVLDCGKIYNALGWRAERNIKEIVQEMWNAA